MISDVRKLFFRNDLKRSCALSGITRLEIKKKSSGRLLATNCRNIVTRCKFLVASLYDISAVPELRNSGKSTKSCEIQINICWYNILFWNLSLLLGLFNCRELANLSWNFITTTSKQHSKTMSCKLCCEKLGTSHDVKSFAKGSFLKHFVVKIANNYLF